jgi:hypothetical protein
LELLACSEVSVRKNIMKESEGIGFMELLAGGEGSHKKDI